MSGLDRRAILKACAAVGLGRTLLPGAILGLAASQAQAQGAAVAELTPQMIRAAAELAAVPISDAQIALMAREVNANREAALAVRRLRLANDVPPAISFDPAPGFAEPRGATRVSTPALSEALLRAAADPKAAGAEAELAFASVRDLAELLRTRRITSVALTELYLARLRRYDPLLKFAVTLTEARALDQARKADAEIAAGRWKGLLHGVPWGVKDLFAVRGYPTTWGAAGFETQTFDTDAAVVRRLDAAGAVLVAKLSVGALALGDVWFGGRTRNPWNPRQGSSGSSAGSASAVAAACVGFAIGTETLGSVVTPSARCGATGLRPTFGLAPREGAMALSWSMDKVGPICRTVEDCAIVLDAIADQRGPAWNADFDWKSLRVGYLKDAFDTPARASTRRRYDATYANAALEALRKLGVTPQPVALPRFPADALLTILKAEAAAAFDDLTLSGGDAKLTGQAEDDWPNLFRAARLIPAVDYLQAQRARTLLLDGMRRLFEAVDVIVAPAGGEQVTATNLSGHPAIVLPTGLRGADAPAPRSADEDGGAGTPTSITFIGAHFQEPRLMALARAYQEATDFHRLRPGLTG